MKKGLTSILLTGLVLLGLVSCNGGSSRGPKENIIDDNYRNYYEIFVYSYCDSDGDKIGDLNGITSKLSYIRDLGYTGIWLTPIFPSSSLHKYNANDYYSIDPSFGTLEDFDNLVSEAHELGINVIMDLALNHSSKSASYFQKAIQAHEYKMNSQTIPEDLKGYEDFYTFYDTLQLAQDSRTTYYQAPGKSFYYEGNFDSDMPEFNFDDENVWTEFDKILTFWQDREVDGFRLDAVKYYYFTDTTKTIEALSKINTIVKRNDPTAYIVGECWDSAGIITSYYQSDVDSYFWFPTATPGFIKSSMGMNGAMKNSYVIGLNTMIAAAGNKIPAPFLDNHDMGRAGVPNKETTKFQYGLLSMLNGTTFTYYGDEIGMGSAAGGTDANYRTHMDWSEDNEGETNNPYNGTEAYYHDPVDKQLKDPDSILNYYRLATRTRNAFPSIARGTIGEIYQGADDDAQVRIPKTYQDEEIIIVINFSGTNSTTYETTKELGSYLPVNGDIIKKGNTYEIPAYGIAVFK